MTTRPLKPTRLYGRKQTRPPGAEQQALLDNLLPRLHVKREGDTRLTAADIFDRPFPSYWLEIGFGTGEHVAGLIRQNPDTGYIAAEPFLNGMGMFLKTIRDDPHDNIRVWMDDAIELTDKLADTLLDGIYVLNPDPWPKRRHHKRRIISRENLDRFARILKPGGHLIMTTDVNDLAGWMVTQAANHPAFTWQAESAADWRTPPEGWLATKYEKKGLSAGRRQTYLIFKRNH